MVFGESGAGRVVFGEVAIGFTGIVIEAII